MDSRAYADSYARREEATRETGRVASLF